MSDVFFGLLLIIKKLKVQTAKSLDFVLVCPHPVEIIQEQDIRLSLKDSRQFGAEHQRRMCSSIVQR
jgi:hypothetical protein